MGAQASARQEGRSAWERSCCRTSGAAIDICRLWPFWQGPFKFSLAGLLSLIRASHGAACTIWVAAASAAAGAQQAGALLCLLPHKKGSAGQERCAAGGCWSWPKLGIRGVEHGEGPRRETSFARCVQHRAAGTRASLRGRRHAMGGAAPPQAQPGPCWGIGALQSTTKGGREGGSSWRCLYNYHGT